MFWSFAELVQEYVVLPRLDQGPYCSFIFPIVDGNVDRFTVKIFPGGTWFTRFGNRRYEGGVYDLFDHCKAEGFSREDLEDMARELE
ncbi:hypothetical protein CsatA_000929 [Cannabis sativa]